MMEQDYASIMRFMLNAWGKEDYYFQEMPEDFVLPSVYFPMPQLMIENNTVSSFKRRYSAYIKIFGEDSKSAQNESYSIASKIVTAIAKGKNNIPILDIEGENTNSWVKIRKLNLKKIDNNTHQIKITWDTHDEYFVDDSQKIQFISFKNLIKGGLE